MKSDGGELAAIDDQGETAQTGWVERRAELEKEAEEHPSRRPETMLALAVTSMASGDTDAARSSLVKSSEAWRRKRILNEDMPLEVGILLWQLGEHDEARRYLEWCLESRYIAALR